MALPFRTFYIYECDGRGRPVKLLAERSSRTSAEAVSRYLHSLKQVGAFGDYSRLKGNVVALTEKVAKTEPIRPPMAKRPVTQLVTEQLPLF